MKKPIYERILLEAEAESKALLNEANAEAKAIVKRGKEAIIAANSAELDAASNANKARVKNFAEREEKGLVTFQEQARQQLVVNIFSEVNEKLAALDGKDLLAFVVHLISKEKVSGDEVFEVAKRNRQKYETALGADLSLLNKTNPQYKFTWSKASTHIEEGFLLSGKKYDLMFDFKEIVDDYQKDHEQGIYHELFTND